MNKIEQTIAVIAEILFQDEQHHIFISVSLFNWQKEIVENPVHSNMLNIISFIAIKLLGDLAENLSV